MKIKIKLTVGLDVTEKRLLKLGFKPKVFNWHKSPKTVFVIGRHMNDCGSFDDTITYIPDEKTIEAHYGGNVYNLNSTKVESMYDIKKFLKERPHEDEEHEHELKYGKNLNGFDVMLVHPGEQRIGVMKLLRDELKISLNECKDYIDSTPKLIKNCGDKKQAEKLQEKFEKIGAEIIIK